MRDRARDILLVTAFLTLVIVPWDSFFKAGIDLAHMLSGPSYAHPLGTDNMGRDLVVRLSTAIRGGVLPLWAGVALASAGGALAGLFAILGAVRSRRVARAVVGLDTAMASMAAVPVGLVVFAWAAVQERAGLGPVIAALAALFWVRSYLTVRDLFRRDEQLGFWTAHAALGGTTLARLLRYGVAGGWRTELLAVLGFQLRVAVAAEASLSFLGFGVQEPQPSFGNMLSSHFDLYLKGHWSVLLVIVGGLALAALFPASLAALLGNAGRSGR